MSNDLVAAWTVAMRAGEFARAWEISDVALERNVAEGHRDLPPHLRWVWDGTPLAGRRVRIVCNHGLGDTVQFIRYAPLVQAIASQLTVEAQPALLPILATAGIDRLVAVDDAPCDVAVDDAPCDVAVEVMELPHVFRSTLDTLPWRVPYLHAPLNRRFDPATLNVGVVWSAGDWAPRRNVPIDLLATIADLPGVTIHALQHAVDPGTLPAEIRPLPLADILATAEAIVALDLVISVDTLTAHLAGALGVPVWTLLRADADWRWLCDRADSPWYPTMRLYRQHREGDWEPVVRRVGLDLLAWRAVRAGQPAERSSR